MLVAAGITKRTNLVIQYEHSNCPSVAFLANFCQSDVSSDVCCVSRQIRPDRQTARQECLSLWRLNEAALKIQVTVTYPHHVSCGFKFIFFANVALTTTGPTRNLSTVKRLLRICLNCRQCFLDLQPLSSY